MSLDMNLIAAAQSSNDQASDDTTVGSESEGEEGAQPKQQRASLDHLLPDDEDLPESLRGKPIKEALRTVNQWRTEAQSANEANRRMHEEQMQLAREMLEDRRAARSSQPQRQAQAPTVYMDNGQGQMVAVRLDQLLAPHIEPLRQQLEEVRGSSYTATAESARLRAKPANISAETWDEMRPEFGAFFAANNLDPTDDRNWKAALRNSLDRLSKLGGVVRGAAPETIPSIPNAPVGNATSSAMPRRGGAPVLNKSDQAELDDIARITGIKRGSKEYAKLAEDVARGYER